MTRPSSAVRVQQALLTDLLRGRYKFRMMVVSDWAIAGLCGRLQDRWPRQAPFRSRCRGVWSRHQGKRLRRMNLKIDQFGGVDDAAVGCGNARQLVTQARNDREHSNAS